MKTIRRALTLALLLGALTPPALAQGPMGRNFGFGIILGTELGGTVKIWTSRTTAVAASIGSTFGDLRLQGDFLWHFFNVFHTPIVNLYAGPGLGFFFGSEGDFPRWWDDHAFPRHGTDFGMGIRAVVGIDVIPPRSPVEIFFHLGPLIGIVPGFGGALDAAVGVRFYP